MLLFPSSHLQFLFLFPWINLTLFSSVSQNEKLQLKNQFKPCRLCRFSVHLTCTVTQRVRVNFTDLLAVWQAPTTATLVCIIRAVHYVLESFRSRNLLFFLLLDHKVQTYFHEENMSINSLNNRRKERMIAVSSLAVLPGLLFMAVKITTWLFSMSSMTTNMRLSRRTKK